MRAQVHLPLVEKSTTMVVEGLRIREKRGTFEILGIWRTTWETRGKNGSWPIWAHYPEVGTVSKLAPRGCFSATHAFNEIRDGIYKNMR